MDYAVGWSPLLDWRALAVLAVWSLAMVGIGLWWGWQWRNARVLASVERALRRLGYRR